MLLSEKELRFAQKDIMNGGRTIAHAGLRLQGTKYEAQYRKIYDALIKLNDMLIKDIKSNK